MLSADRSDRGPFWTRPMPVGQAELSPCVLDEIDANGGRTGFRGYILQIFDTPDARPSGVLEIALNRKQHRACGIYESEASGPAARRDRVVLMTDPVWFAASTPQEAANVLYQTLVDRAPDL
ncbi:hypothetical protein HT585_15925 [Ensifer sp. HO-A22]|jgi:hypothetical protein|uniref:Uncharacterized protein n=1 Tax=Ensifer oleiphilus TaxID=2742698 RepID=A0A7Y6Q792_9HYPH|nr:hypothetical protein [Ensifer oleiphilus]NVD40357.1 hypothetical protein [Ensifer oleiphilus]